MVESERLRVRARIKGHEGTEKANGLHVAYQDSEGFWTIAYGMLIDRARGGGLTDAEAEYLLLNRIRVAERECESIDVYHELSPARQGVLIEMCFNMGLPALLGFKKMFAALRGQAFGEAAAEMLDSQWARQVKQRAVTLSQVMAHG